MSEPTETERRAAEVLSDRDRLTQVLARCSDCGHDWSGHPESPNPYLSCEGKRGLGYIAGCKCTLTRVDAVLAAGYVRPEDAVERILAARSDSGLRAR